MTILAAPSGQQGSQSAPGVLSGLPGSSQGRARSPPVQPPFGIPHGDAGAAPAEPKARQGVMADHLRAVCQGVMAVSDRRTGRTANVDGHAVHGGPLLEGVGMVARLTGATGGAAMTALLVRPRLRSVSPVPRRPRRPGCIAG